MNVRLRGPFTFRRRVKPMKSLVRILILALLVCLVVPAASGCGKTTEGKSSS